MGIGKNAVPLAIIATIGAEAVNSCTPTEDNHTLYEITDNTPLVQKLTLTPDVKLNEYTIDQALENPDNLFIVAQEFGNSTAFEIYDVSISNQDNTTQPICIANGVLDHTGKVSSVYQHIPASSVENTNKKCALENFRIEIEQQKSGLTLLYVYPTEENTPIEVIAGEDKDKLIEELQTIREKYAGAPQTSDAIAMFREDPAHGSAFSKAGRGRPI